MTDYNSKDVRQVCESRFGQVLPSEILDKLVVTVDRFKLDLKQRLFGAYGSPWQFNLRDLMRICQGIAQDDKNMVKYLQLIFAQRFRTSSDQEYARHILAKIFDKDTFEADHIGFQLPVLHHRQHPQSLQQLLALLAGAGSYAEADHFKL